MTNIRNILAINMKARRKEMNLSQAELAEKIGTSPNYISKIEAERQFPSVQMIEKIAIALSFGTVDLFSIKRIRETKLETVRDSLCNEITDLIRNSFTEIE